MIKKTVLLFAALLVSAAAFSQVTFGVKAGVNVAKITDLTGDIIGTSSNNIHITGKSRVGFNVGGIVEYRASNMFGLQGELVYSLQGAEGEGTVSVEGLGLKSHIQLDMHYINLPILAKLYLTDAIAIELGPQFGYCVDHTYDASIVGVGFNGTLGDNVVNDFDVALAMGMSFRFGNLGLNARYNLGLTEMSDGIYIAGYHFDGNGTYKNNVFQAGLFFMF